MATVPSNNMIMAMHSGTDGRYKIPQIVTQHAYAHLCHNKRTDSWKMRHFGGIYTLNGH